LKSVQKKHNDFYLLNHSVIRIMDTTGTLITENCDTNWI